MLTGPCDFHFDDAIAGFFELPTEDARRLVPEGLQPLERCHGRSVFAALAFDFRGGEVGPYREIVLAILVVPRIESDAPFPHSAMYPFQIGTSTPRARDHGRLHYHLPHYERDIDVMFARDVAGTTVLASEGQPILELRVGAGPAVPAARVRRYYQVVSVRDGTLYAADVAMSGDNVEHEDETGAIELHTHAFTKALDPDRVSRWPFREQRMSDGTERFWPARPMRGGWGMKAPRGGG